MYQKLFKLFDVSQKVGGQRWLKIGFPGNIQESSGFLQADSAKQLIELPSTNILWRLDVDQYSNFKLSAPRHRRRTVTIPLTQKKLKEAMPSTAYCQNY